MKRHSLWLLFFVPLLTACPPLPYHYVPLYKIDPPKLTLAFNVSPVFNSALDPIPDFTVVLSVVSKPYP